MLPLLQQTFNFLSIQFDQFYKAYQIFFNMVLTITFIVDIDVEKWRFERAFYFCIKRLLFRFGEN